MLAKEASCYGRLVLVFVENYSVTKAEKMIPAADLSEQISTAGWEASGTGNMKLAMNGALTIGTEDGANIEMKEAVKAPYWPFSFGASAEDNKKHYHPQELLGKDQEIKAIVEALVDGSLTSGDEEARALRELYEELTTVDRFRVLQDLRAYYETQKKVEELYQKPALWTEHVIMNISGMGYFSSDRSMQEYVNKVWGISPLSSSEK
jgi:starch phosphorylase